MGSWLLFVHIPLCFRMYFISKTNSCMWVIATFEHIMAATFDSLKLDIFSLLPCQSSRPVEMTPGMASHWHVGLGCCVGSLCSWIPCMGQGWSVISIHQSRAGSGLQTDPMQSIQLIDQPCTAHPAGGFHYSFIPIVHHQYNSINWMLIGVTCAPLVGICNLTWRNVVLETDDICGYSSVELQWLSIDKYIFIRFIWVIHLWQATSSCLHIFRVGLDLEILLQGCLEEREN